MQSRSPFKLEFRITVKDGIRHIRALANRVLNKEGEVERLLGINMDMTEVKQLNEALFQEKERLHITLDSIGEAVVCIDMAMKITFMNPVAEKMSGWTQEEALGVPLLTVLHITFGDNGPLMENIYSADTSRSAIEQDVVLHCRSGGSYDVHYSITPLSTLDGSNIGSVLVIQDVTESRKMLRQLSYSASHDALTHLANRASFEKQLRILLQTVNSTHQRHALVFIDLDRFKAVNDYHFIWEGRVHRVGASAGITLIDDNNHQAAEVMSQADIACYASKNGGRGRVTVYEPQQAAAHSERAAMSLDEQWRMIKENQLMMLAHGVASPRIPEARNLWLISLKLWSCEGEIIDEQTFRRSFSDPALSHALDRRVFHEFFQQAAKAVASKGISISLPLSVAGLSSATLVNDLLEQLENSPLPPRLLHLIIPAEAILDHAESVQKLRLAGCRIVLSQVGRDLQIFNSLKANMADYLLLDGELCANVQGNLMDEMLITIIQGHAQRLGMKTIAGPVVLPLVMDTLSGIGVDLIYGEVIADAQPLDLLVNSSYFAIN